MTGFEEGDLEGGGDCCGNAAAGVGGDGLVGSSGYMIFYWCSSLRCLGWDWGKMEGRGGALPELVGMGYCLGVSIAFYCIRW